MVSKRVRVGPRGGVSPYKNLLSALPGVLEGSLQRQVGGLPMVGYTERLCTNEMPFKLSVYLR